MRIVIGVGDNQCSFIYLFIHPTNNYQVSIIISSERIIQWNRGRAHWELGGVRWGATPGVGGEEYGIEWSASIVIED